MMKQYSNKQAWEELGLALLKMELETGLDMISYLLHQFG